MKLRSRVPVVGDIVFVEWADAYSPDDGSWTDVDFVVKTLEAGGYGVRSVGFLLAETDEYMALVGSESSMGGSCSGTIIIPKGWIRSQRVLVRAS